MAKKLLMVICSLLLLGMIGLGAGLLGVVLLSGGGSEVPEPAPVPEKRPPVKHAPEKNLPEEGPPEKDPPEGKDPPEEKDPTFGLPLEITIEGVPEVPKEILGPSPPIEEEEKEN